MVQVAWAAAHQKNSPLANYFYAVKRRRGTNKALIALAHKLVRIIYALFIRRETFDLAKLSASPAPTKPTPPTEVKEDFPDVSELSEGLAHIVDMAGDDDLPEEHPSSENHFISTSPQAVLPPAKESTTTTEPVARRRERPRKKQTEG